MKSIKPIGLALIIALLLSTMPALRAESWQGTDMEKRIDALLARMTIEEKLGQLQQLDGEANGNFHPEHLDMIRKGLLGSTLNVRGAGRTNELQRVAMTESRAHRQAMQLPTCSLAT